MKAIVALAYLALLLWIGWLGIGDRGGDWSNIVVILFWLLWLGASVAVGVALSRADALWLPAAAFVGLVAYVAGWPDEASNEVWLLNIGLEMVISALFEGAGVALGRRRGSRRSTA